jgi:hypothetical protein
MNVDCVGVRRRPNNSISGGRDAPWMLSVSLPESRRSRQAGMGRNIRHQVAVGAVASASPTR